MRQAFFGLNFPQRQAFLNLATHHTKLQTLADSPETDPSIHQASQVLQRHIQQVWAVLGQLQSAPAEALQTLDELWLQLPALRAPSGARSTAWRSLLKTRLDIQKDVRALRSELWENRPLLEQINNLGGLGPVSYTHLRAHET